MSFNPVSKTETPSVTAPPSSSSSSSPSSLSSPSPQLPLMIFSANAESHSPSFRQPLNRPNPNHRTLGDYGLSVGPGGFRFADSTLNPLPSFGSLCLDPNPTQIKFSPGLGFSNSKLTEKPAGVGLVEGSEKKGKSKITFQLPERNKTWVSGSDSVAANDSDKVETDVSDKREALELCGKEEEEEGKKTWNLRPRKEKKGGKSRTSNGGGGRRSVVEESKQPKMPTRPRTPRGAQGGGAAAASTRPMFSLTLTKSEIEEDFLKMTGQLPPKKPQRRSKNVEKRMDGIFPGMFLDKVTPQTYNVPDPPLKR